MVVRLVAKSIFRLGGKEWALLQIVVVVAMAGRIPSFVHPWPGVFEVLFSPAWAEFGRMISNSGTFVLFGNVFEL